MHLNFQSKMHLTQVYIIDLRTCSSVACFFFFKDFFFIRYHVNIQPSIVALYNLSGPGDHDLNNLESKLLI